MQQTSETAKSAGIKRNKPGAGVNPGSDSQARVDAVIVGSGPNGLAAAITLAEQGFAVLVIEAKDTPGGGTGTLELTLPGFWHDMCSAIHPLGIASPFFKRLNLTSLGVEWIHPDLPLAHPLEDGRVAVLARSIDETAKGLDQDGKAWADLMRPLVENSTALLEDLLSPLPFPPRHPFLLARFGLSALQSGRGLAERHFSGDLARAMFGGIAAHAIMSIDKMATASFGLVLGMIAHAVGWPMPRGGSRQISAAMVRKLESLGGRVVTGWEVKSLAELPPHRAVLLDVTPRQLLRIAGDRLPGGYRRQLERYRYGPGVFKIDYALDGPVPWKADDCRKAGTVHVGGALDEIAASERAAFLGRHSQRPYVLFAQQSLFDPGRAPIGKHTGWAYCHVPNGSTEDMTGCIEAQIERFAPGFRDCIIERHVTNAAEMQVYNANYRGGDINGGVQDLLQMWTRPVLSLNPYATPLEGVYLCSSSTPPGGGVHGMCGYWAAQAAMKGTLRG